MKFNPRKYLLFAISHFLPNKRWNFFWIFTILLFSVAIPFTKVFVQILSLYFVHLMWPITILYLRLCSANTINKAKPKISKMFAIIIAFSLKKKTSKTQLLPFFNFYNQTAIIMKLTFFVLLFLFFAMALASDFKFLSIIKALSMIIAEFSEKVDDTLTQSHYSLPKKP